ncbi:MAG: hypothetical protein LBU12_05525 [Deltaproteobacteria bacterium]|jgi:hypothetical protein|nr:hypothetical protein [Deltaproteobacteria bacterium]
MQIDDALVELVTTEILKRLKAASDGAAVPAPRTPLLTVGSLDGLAPQTRAALEARHEITPAEGREPGQWPPAPVLLTSLGLQALVRTAQGDEGCTVEGMVLLSALLEGRRAVALEEGLVWRRHKDTAPRSLVSVYLACEAALKNAGLRIVDESRLLDALADPAAGRPSNLTPLPPNLTPNLTPRTRVLTETRVQELFPPSTGPEARVLRLTPGDVLTPLARDWLLAKKIAVVAG